MKKDNKSQDNTKSEELNSAQLATAKGGLGEGGWHNLDSGNYIVAPIIRTPRKL